MKEMKIEFKIPMSILKEGDKFIAFTPVLDLSTSGRSIKSVKKNFSEIVEIFFDELIKNGTLDEVLADLGWRRVKKQWSPPEEVAHSQKLLRMPIMAL